MSTTLNAAVLEVEARISMMEAQLENVKSRLVFLREELVSTSSSCRDVPTSFCLSRVRGTIEMIEKTLEEHNLIEARIKSTREVLAVLKK